MTLDAEVRAVADAHNWSFQQAWEYLQATQPALFKGSSGKPVEKDPRIAQEMARHKKLSDVRQSNSAGEHVERLAKIRKLMADNPEMTFDAAFTQICQEENQAKAAPVSAAQTLMRVECDQGPRFDPEEMYY